MAIEFDDNLNRNKDIDNPASAIALGLGVILGVALLILVVYFGENVEGIAGAVCVGTLFFIFVGIFSYAFISIKNRFIRTICWFLLGFTITPVVLIIFIITFNIGGECYYPGGGSVGITC